MSQGKPLMGRCRPLPSVKEHHRALPYTEVSRALATIEASGASLSAKLCFRFLVLMAARSGEARGATWDEIDMGKKMWTIPASKMKGKAEHRVRYPMRRYAC